VGIKNIGEELSFPYLPVISLNNFTNELQELFISQSTPLNDVLLCWMEKKAIMVMRSIAQTSASVPKFCWVSPPLPLQV